MDIEPQLTPILNFVLHVVEGVEKVQMSLELVWIENRVCSHVDEGVREGGAIKR